MTTLHGTLRPTPDADLAGYRVTATFEAPMLLPDGTSSEVFAPAGRTTVAAADGTFSIELPDGWRQPLRIAVNAPTGVETGAREVTAAEAAQPIEIAVTPVAPTPITPSDDPTLGRRERLTGRVLDQQGAGARAGLLVVIWGVPKDGTAADAYPLLVAETTAGGYFSEIWPADLLAEAWARIAGTAPIRIPLDGDRLPHTVVLVVGILPEPAAPSDCECVTTPPRAPDEIDLVTNPAFSSDKGTCVDLTVPNRALEEVAFEAVVRTSQPEIKGVTLPAAVRVPPHLIDRLVSLVGTNPTTRRLSTRRDKGAPEERELPPATRPVGEAPLRLVPSVVADLVRDQDELTVDTLLNAERVSLVRSVRDAISVLDRPAPGRVVLDSRHSIDWDDTPTTYQATTIAHGHLLTMKQVWRADGYSLGDLLYSLPLAPGQKKLIAVVDWNRREDAARQASRRATEQVSASLAQDRDISEIITASLREQTRGRSRADVEGFGAGVAGFIGPVVFGLAGGIAGAGSGASQRSFRDVTATSLNQARDRTLEAASSVRSQRATVVQTARQGESVRVQTDVVANHNHCHAVTIEYFEVLRHFQVTQELADVQECLFVPFELSAFTSAKALRHREPLALALRRSEVAGGFDALERIRTNWADADYPLARYADERITFLDGELWMIFSMPRPRDTAADDYDAAQWGPYGSLLTDLSETVWRNNLGVAMPADRNTIWNTRIAPGIAQRLVNRLKLTLVLDGTSSESVEIDTTLVSRFEQDQRLLVSIRPRATTPPVVRARIRRVKVSLASVLPATAKIVVERVSMRYRTDHMEHSLFTEHLAYNDLGFGDDVEIPVGLDRDEKRNPRKEDVRLAETLVAHLNEHVEYYHQAIWLFMDPNRRYLLMDGFIAPNAGGRSVASVVENRLIGIVGNCLVMPVVPGVQLDTSYEYASLDPASLLDLYATTPVPPMRISVPTKGIFAEAVMGTCNSCELKDDTKFWQWEDAPIPDEPTGIDQVSTTTRRGRPPTISLDNFPENLVKGQTYQTAPTFTGLSEALALIGTQNLFRDITGLGANQTASSEAFEAVTRTAGYFAEEGLALAQQRYLSQDLDRKMKRIKDARDSKLITDEQANAYAKSLLTGVIGGKRPAAASVTENPSMKGVLNRVKESDNATLKVERPDGTVEVRKGEHAPGALSFAVAPPVTPVQQRNDRTCWAAAGTMMLAWRERKAMTTDEVLTELGGEWLAKFNLNEPLTPAEVVAFTGALGLTGEQPTTLAPRALARLLQQHGPLWVIGDDAIQDNRLAHVNIVTGISGDGSPEGTTVTLIDPAEPASPPQNYAVFARSLQARDAIAAGLGVFHF